MAGNGPRPCGRQSMACSVADPLWMSTVSGPPDFWPQAVAAVSVRTSGARKNTYSLVILALPKLDTTDANHGRNGGPVYLKSRPQEVLPATFWLSYCRTSVN